MFILFRCRRHPFYERRIIGNDLVVNANCQAFPRNDIRSFNVLSFNKNKPVWRSANLS